MWQKSCLFSIEREMTFVSEIALEPKVFKRHTQYSTGLFRPGRGLILVARFSLFQV
jgi:hypothetical protein